MSTVRDPLIRTDIPHSARIWNYWMGGKDYYEIDQMAGDAAVEVYPDVIRMAVQSRQFLVRVVDHLAQVGVDQFLDIGTGLPTMQDIHQIAQAIIPKSKVIYVDNDPLVLAHARALLTATTAEGVTTYIDSDYHFPEQIISDARTVLDFGRPIAVMFMGVLGYASSYDDMVRIVRTVMGAMPSGSYLALWDGTDDSSRYVTMCQNYNLTGAAPYIPRPQGQLETAFDGLVLIDPGFTSISEWRCSDIEVGKIEPVSAYGGVARKL